MKGRAAGHQSGVAGRDWPGTRIGGPTGDSTDADSNEDGEEAAPTLVDASSSSAEEEDHEDEEGNERPTAGTYARPRPFYYTPERCQAQLRNVAKRNLRIIQEQLDTEMANAAQGLVMGEGAYVAMMNAVKGLWESVDP